MLYNSMKHSIIIKDTDDLFRAAGEFIRETEGHNIIAFHAPMGAGKTTFIKALCNCLGVSSDTVSSPTFAIVNEYAAGSGDAIYHFDFYRITKEEEALDIGLYDYLDSGSLCLIEWPENIASLLPEETLMVDISVGDDGSRTISWRD